MKAYQAIYKNGQFIDIESKQSIMLVQGAKYIITAEDSAFIFEDKKQRTIEVLDSEKKENLIKKKYGSDNYVKIMNSNDQLFYRVGSSKIHEGDKSYEYIFICTLLEDLYLYLLNGARGIYPKDWRLAECECVLDGCLPENLSLPGKVYAHSLNELFSKTVQSFFNLKRSGSTNSFDTFFIYQKGMSIAYNLIYRDNYKCLSHLRQEVAKKNIIGSFNLKYQM
ncbi:MAG: hypothetical protein AB9922_08110 [Bacteroidales bacterium]